MYSFTCNCILLCLYTNQISGNIPLTINAKLAMHHVLEADKDSTLPSCADKCVYKTDCVSFSFSRVTKVCEMYKNSASNIPSNEIQRQDHAVLIEAVNWPKFRTGACWNKPCGPNTTCEPNGNTYVCHKDEEIGCKLFALPEHGYVINLGDYKGGLYPIGSRICLDCDRPYYTSSGLWDTCWHSHCYPSLNWDFSHYSCHTPEELCIYPILERLYPNRTEINVTSSVPDWNATDVFLNSTKGWQATTNNDQQYIQIQFNAKYLIGGVVSRGGSNNTWVKSYNVTVSEDCINFDYVTDPDSGFIKEFLGNIDATNIVKNIFDRIINTKCLRILPTDYHGRISMRLEILGCKKEYNL